MCSDTVRGGKSYGVVDVSSAVVGGWAKVVVADLLCKGLVDVCTGLLALVTDAVAFVVFVALHVMEGVVESVSTLGWGDWAPGSLGKECECCKSEDRTMQSQ